MFISAIRICPGEEQHNGEEESDEVSVLWYTPSKARVALRKRWPVRRTSLRFCCGTSFPCQSRTGCRCRSFFDLWALILIRFTTVINLRPRFCPVACQGELGTIWKHDLLSLLYPAVSLVKGSRVPWVCIVLCKCEIRLV